MNNESRIKGIINRIHSKGFTLIELLVAIGIIGILASFLLANFVGVRQRARDGVRKSDLRQIQSALELYRADQGYYPSALTLSCGCSLTPAGIVCPTASSGTVVYMKKIPCDPSSAESYVYTSSGSDIGSGKSGYSVVGCLENDRDSQKDPTDICSGAPVSYTLQSP